MIEIPQLLTYAITSNGLWRHGGVSSEYMNCWTCSLALPSSTSRFVPTTRIYLFRSFSPCSSISIHHLHPSCLVSALLSTVYGPRRNAIDDFSRQPPLLLQPPSSRNQLELYLFLSPSDFEVFIPYLRPTSTLAHRFPSALSNLSSQQYLESQEARNPIACRRPVNRNPIVNRHPAIPCTSLQLSLFSSRLCSSLLYFRLATASCPR